MAAQFEKAVVTDEGRSLIAGSEGTQTALEFTGMATGAGVYTAAQATVAELKVKTELKDQKQLFPISGLRKYNTETALVKGVLTNEDLEEAYNWNEVGIYARLKGSGLDPVLFCFHQNNNGGVRYNIGLRFPWQMPFLGTGNPLFYQPSGQIIIFLLQSRK